MACIADILALWMSLTEEEKKEFLEKNLSQLRSEVPRAEESSNVPCVAV